MPNFKPKDLIAALTLILITVLLLAGKDGSMSAAGALIIGYYFAHRQNGSDKGI